MGQAIYHQFPGYKTTWSFKCRNEDVHFTAEMVEEIRQQVRAYCDLRFTEEELAYIDGIHTERLGQQGKFLDLLIMCKLLLQRIDTLFKDRKSVV